MHFFKNLLYKSEIEIFNKFLISKSVSICIIGNDYTTTRIINQTLQIHQSTMHTYGEIDQLLQIVEPFIDNWDFSVKKTKNNYIDLWKQQIETFPIYQYYIICDDSFYNTNDNSQIDESDANAQQQDTMLANHPPKRYIERINRWLQFIHKITRNVHTLDLSWQKIHTTFFLG